MAYASDSGSNLNKPPKLPVQFRPLVPQSKPLTSPALPVNLTKPPDWRSWSGSEPKDVGLYEPPLIAKGVPVTPSAEYVNSQMMMRWRSTTSLGAEQLAAMFPDVNPRVLQQITNKMTVLYNPYMTGDPQSGEKYVMMRGNNMDAAGIKATLGHELVHAWETISPWANAIVGATTVMNYVRKVPGEFLNRIGAGNTTLAKNITARTTDILRSGYTQPLSSEWLASKYYGPPGTNTLGKAKALKGFLR